MRKISLNLDLLTVESFETAAADRGLGTVEGYAFTNGGRKCDSAVDACPSRLCDTVVCETVECDTYDLCPSAYDACVSARGCTVVAPCGV